MTHLMNCQLLQNKSDMEFETPGRNELYKYINAIFQKSCEI